MKLELFQVVVGQKAKAVAIDAGRIAKVRLRLKADMVQEATDSVDVPILDGQSRNIRLSRVNRSRGRWTVHLGSQ
jgi:hypothetical protein